MKTRFVILAIIGLMAVGSIGYYFGFDHGFEKKALVISSFVDCEAAGYPVGESYPRQCWTPDGQNFTEKITEPIGEFWGSIYGVVMLGPICPVEMNPPDPKCADRPFQTRLAVTTIDQTRVIKEFSSDANGRFNVEVPPGQYVIRSAATANILPYCSTTEINVRANEGTEIIVYCDSGIR